MPALGCDAVPTHQTIAIVDPETHHRCPPGEVGEIWLLGPSAAESYWCEPRRPLGDWGAYTRDTGDGPYLRTGDSGFLRDGELVLTGRLDGLMRIHGVDHYPGDIERTVKLSHLMRQR